jgi:hypothetical protein
MNIWNKFWLILLPVLFVGTAPAQTPISSKQRPAVSNSLAELTNANREFKSNSEDVIRLQEEEIAKATNELEQLRQLVAEGLVARNELEASELKLNQMRSNLAATRRQIVDSERLVAEIRRSEELAKTQALKASQSRSLVRPTAMRYTGSAGWSIATGLAGVQQFFLSNFGRVLPTSAVGQSATHNRMGWDHRHAVDVPIHPDSAEGRALIAYLQSNKIPFLAFRGAVPGVSTGPHIHIGSPSHRLS